MTLAAGPTHFRCHAGETMLGAYIPSLVLGDIVRSAGRGPGPAAGTPVWGAGGGLAVDVAPGTLCGVLGPSLVVGVRWPDPGVAPPWRASSPKAAHQHIDRSVHVAV